MFCIDFGASGGVDRNLEKMLPDAKIALLEPGLEFFKKLPKKEGLVNLRAAAGRYSNETYLFNYQTPGASIYKENSKILKRYAQHVVERKENKQNKIKIKITSIKKILKKISFNRVDAIKIDTQGSELKILEGLKDAGKLKNVCSIFCEAQSIPESYINSPKMIHILNFLSKNDFELFDILPNRAFALIKKDSFKVPNFLGTSAKTMDIDLLFFKSQNYILKMKNADLLFRQIISYCSYNYYLEAIQLVNDSEKTFLNKRCSIEILNYIENKYKKNTSLFLKILNLSPKKFFIINFIKNILNQGIKRGFPHGS